VEKLHDATTRPTHKNPSGKQIPSSMTAAKRCTARSVFQTRQIQKVLHQRHTPSYTFTRIDLQAKIQLHKSLPSGICSLSKSLLSSDVKLTTYTCQQGSKHQIEVHGASEIPKFRTTACDVLRYHLRLKFLSSSASSLEVEPSYACLLYECLELDL